MPWLMDRVCEEIEKSELGRLVVDGMIREIVAARSQAYQVRHHYSHSYKVSLVTVSLLHSILTIHSNTSILIYLFTLYTASDNQLLQASIVIISLHSSSPFLFIIISFITPLSASCTRKGSEAGSRRS